MSWPDLFCGNIITSHIKKLGVDLTTFESFVKNFYDECQKKNLEPEKIIKYGEKLFLLEQQSDVVLEKLPEKYQSLLNKKEYLEKEITQLTQDAKNSRSKTRVILDKNDQTIEKLDSFINSKNILENSGFTLDDYTKLAIMLQNAKDNGYDASKIVTYLNQDKSLESALQEKQSRLDEIKAKTSESTKKHEELYLKNENLTLRHDSMLKSIKSVKYLSENGVLVKTIPVWQQIFDSFGMEPDEFIKELKQIGDKNQLHYNLDNRNSKLKKEIIRLEKKKSWLENEVDGLKSEISNGVEFGKKNLTKITDHAESQINHTITLTKKSLDNFMKNNQNQINLSQKQLEDYFLELTLKLEEVIEHSHKAERSLGQMESLKPLVGLINGKFDPVTSIPQVVLILNKLYVDIKKTSLDKRLLSSDIKRLSEHLLDLISHA